MTAFETFQREFKKWQHEFGLSGYKVYFKHEPIDDAFANITFDQLEYIATVRLNSTPGKDGDVKRSAKHEAIHLLLARLNYIAIKRFIDSDVIDEEIESLVHKLEELIP